MADDEILNPDGGTPPDTSNEPVLLLSRAPDSSDSATLKVDASIEETHSAKSTITDHPVEEGEPISDHSRPEPEGLTAQCVVSNTPVDTGERAINVTQGAYTFQSQTPGGIDVNRGRAFWARLNRERLAGTLFTVATKLRRYRSMAIESLSAIQNAKNSEGVEFTAVFKHVVVVKNARHTVTSPKDKRVTKKAKTGAAAPAPVIPESTAFKAADATSGYAKDSGNGTLSGFGSAVQGFLH